MSNRRDREGVGFVVPDAEERHLDPITIRIAVAVRLTGISRSTLYELIKAGKIETVKVGRLTLVNYRSLQRLVGCS